MSRVGFWVGTGLTLLLVAGWARPVSGRSASARTMQSEQSEVVIHVKAERWEFSPAEIRVSEGDHVRIELETLDGTHGIEIKPFKVKGSVHRHETRTLEFVADKVGTFVIACSEHCGRGHEHMRARLVVQPKAELAR